MMQTHRRRQRTPLYICWSNFGCLGENYQSQWGTSSNLQTRQRLKMVWFYFLILKSPHLVKWIHNSMQSKSLRCIIHWPPGVVVVFFFTLLSSGWSRELGSAARCSSAPLAALHVHWTGEGGRKSVLSCTLSPHFQDQTSQKGARQNQAT